MPVYNAERYVAEAVESILNQTFRDFECLIIDDGSTDGSLKILRKYAKADERIKLISRPNTGYIVALNEMLSLAKGQFLARMDADDLARPGRFHAQVRTLRASPDVVALGTGWAPLHPDGRQGARSRVLCKHTHIERSLLLGRAVSILHPTVMMRRQAVEVVGGYRQHMRNLHEELDLFLRLARVGQLGNLEQVFLLWRRHPHSASAVGVHDPESTGAVEQILREAYAERALKYPPDWERDLFRADPVRAYMDRGWQALRDRRPIRAFFSACRVVTLAPNYLSGWKLLACSIRGH